MTRPKNKGFIPYSCQSIDDSDIKAVVDCLKSDYLTTGPLVEQFEQTVADYCGAPYAVATSSGTAALHVACHAMDITNDSLVWTSANSFVASANCARYMGANVDFIDIDSATGNLDLDNLESRLKQANKKPDLVIPVHFSGRAVDMNRLEKLSQEHTFAILEDAAHGLGASYDDGNKIGSKQTAIFSFHPVKPITTGEGGIIVTHDKMLATRMRILRSHGITRDIENAQDEPWVYEMRELGYHYRLTDLQATLGLSQTKRLDQFISRRRELAKRYHAALADLPLTLPPPSDQSGWHLYVIQLHDASKRADIFKQLRAAQIGVNVHYQPINQQPYYATLGHSAEDTPIAADYYSRALSLPLHQGLSDEDQDYIINTLRNILETA